MPNPVVPANEVLSFSPMGLVVNGEVTYEVWENALLQATRMRSALTWAIGDLLVYGQAAYGEMYAQAEAMTGMDYGSLRNIAYCSRAIPQPERVPELTWRHHYLTASLEPGDRQQWLARARDEHMNTEELRLSIKEAVRNALPAPEFNAVQPLPVSAAQENAIDLGVFQDSDYLQILWASLPIAVRDWLNAHPNARLRFED